MIDLMKCPFCGSDAKMVVMQNAGVSVKCTNGSCKCQTSYMYDSFGLLGAWPEKNAVEEVIKRWNRRDTPSDENDEEE